MQNIIHSISSFLSNLDWNTLLAAVFLAIMIDILLDIKKYAFKWSEKLAKQIKKYLLLTLSFPKQVIVNFKNRPQRLMAKNIESFLKVSTEDLFRIRVFFSRDIPSFIIEDVREKPLRGGESQKVTILKTPIEYFWGAFYKYTENQPELMRSREEKYLSYRISRQNTLRFVNELKSQKLYKSIKNKEYIPTPSEFMNMVEWEIKINDCYESRIENPINAPDESVLIRKSPDKLILSASNMSLHAEICRDFKWSKDEKGTLFLAQSSGDSHPSYSSIPVNAPQMTLITESGFVVVREKNREIKSWKLSASDLLMLRSKLEIWKVWGSLN